MDLKNSEFDSKYNILDIATPRNELLSGKYKRSFAYHTLRERLPVILTQIIDSLTRDKDEIAENYEGEKTRDELKEIVGKISKLKYQLQTDKVFEKFQGQEADKELWNTFIDALDQNSNSFFQSVWLYAECYMYRKVASFFENSTTVRGYDYFFKQKVNGWKMDEIVSVCKHLRNTEKNLETFARILKLNLWGNRCDLSIIIPTNFGQSDNFFDHTETFNPNILVDNSTSVWNCLQAADHSKPVIVDIILDNAGFELFTDFVLADYLLDKQLASKVRFHVKAWPWFVSDTTSADFDYGFSYLCKHDSNYVSELGRKWTQFVTDGLIEMAPIENFWTSPYEFYKMREVDPDLYNYLSEAHLIIFKGDLNYRKLLGDKNWDVTDDFLTCLRGFQPSNLCSLRTLKADLICGLEQGQAERISKLSPNWLISGEYGVIQFMEANACKSASQSK